VISAGPRSSANCPAGAPVARSGRVIATRAEGFHERGARVDQPGSHGDDLVVGEQLPPPVAVRGLMRPFQDAPEPSGVQVGDDRPPSQGSGPGTLSSRLVLSPVDACAADASCRAARSASRAVTRSRRIIALRSAFASSIDWARASPVRAFVPGTGQAAGRN